MLSLVFDAIRAHRRSLESMRRRPGVAGPPLAGALCTSWRTGGGLEGALASVVAGMVPCPVIAVPTSVGYGASFGGIAALLGMLNSCAAGVSVVNIDNGFGAATQAIRINGLPIE